MDLLSLGWTEWTMVGIVLILALYKYGTRNHNFFTSRGIKGPKPVPFFGSMAGPSFRTKSFATLVEEAYKEFRNERLVGCFQFQFPVFVVNDPELIKRIAVKDFDHFTDHDQSLTDAADPLFARSLFSLRGERWRDLRNTLSPAFTSSKIKAMFNFIDECGSQLGDYIQDNINKQEPGKLFVLEMKELFTRFTNDVIATSAFGIHMDSFKEKDNNFYKMGRQITDFEGIKALFFTAFFIAPKLMMLLGFTLFTKKEHQFFEDLVHQTISAREKHGIVRPDMIHLLMQARSGELKAEAGEEEGTLNGVLKAKKITLTEEDIAAQAMIFFFAGFDTASTLLSWASLLLAMHEDVQRKLQDEMDEILAGDSNVTYEKVQKMKYLDMVLSETLRLYPPTIMLDRYCTKDYVIPPTDTQPGVTLKKGTLVWLPSYAIQRDPEYYSDPEKFYPERFSDENKVNMKPYTYMPFGLGPRLCIGQRFALLEAKVAIIHLVSRFDLKVVEKTPLPLKLSAKGFVMSPEGGFWIGIQQRKKHS